MSFLYISEFTALQPTTGGNNLAMAAQPSNRDQQIAITSAAATSSAFLNNTYFVRLHTDVINSVVFGSSPTATTTNARMAANQTEYFAVIPGQKVSVISNS